MDILIYNELDPKKIPGFDKLYQLLQQDDFKSADVKKIQTNLYRAKLNRSDRILFSIYQHQQRKYLLILEYLKKHDYQGSRFLNGLTAVNASQLPIEQVEALDPAADLVYINPNNPKFVYLNKFISFDDVQQHIYEQALPLMIIGSAGSGKTAILLEKMKRLAGRVLYVTLSSFLVKNSRELYYAQDYYNSEQQVDFYTFDEFVDTIAVPSTHPATAAFFYAWYAQQEGLKLNPQHLYEEFRGVLTGATTESAYLSEADYLALGLKQSIFDAQDRPQVYAVFLRYIQALEQQHYHDSNILSFEYLSQVRATYDYVVIDEVQDITAVQLYLILKSLKRQGLFLLCGDANQVVHPNFFSWAKIKTLFYHDAHLHEGQEITHILHYNYRNAKRVTEIANRTLLLKHARFGSIDKESHYLVETQADVAGGVYFLKNRPNIIAELDQKTAVSTQFAVIVMHEHQKKSAQRFFKTPLVFSIQEAKGLEYSNIILYNFVSTAKHEFNAICAGLNAQDLQREFKYARNKDKYDKSLEIYKFYINALYVGLTRAMQHLYWIEQDDQHRIFQLLGMQQAADQLNLSEQQSSLKAWQKEAQRLELQGKTEQAQRIRTEILKEQRPDWEVLSGSNLKQVVQQALVEGHKKAKLQLFEYAVVYLHQRYLVQLAASGFKPAQQIFAADFSLKTYKAEQALLAKAYSEFKGKHATALMKKIDTFGLNYRNAFDQTPLQAAVWVGDSALFTQLYQQGADLELLDAAQHHLFQLALRRALQSEKYSQTFLAQHVHDLPQPCLQLQLNQRLFQLAPQQPEYLIFQLIYVMWAVQIWAHFAQHSRWVCSGILLHHIQHLPADLWPQQRRNRRYLNALLSKHEIHSNDPHSKQLFQRVARGQYILNPNLAIKLQGEWHSLYARIGLDRIADYPIERIECTAGSNAQRVDQLAQYQDFLSVLGQL